MAPQVVHPQLSDRGGGALCGSFNPTVLAWHKVGSRKTLSGYAKRAALSYMQLIEVAVVAAFRRSDACGHAKNVGECLAARELRR